MYRVALKMEWHPAPKRDGEELPVWKVAKCYAVRPQAEPYTLPVKVDAPGGDRRRLLILTPYYTPPGQYHTPYEILSAYLLALPAEVKRAREAEMRTAP